MVEVCVSEHGYGYGNSYMRVDVYMNMGMDVSVHGCVVIPWMVRVRNRQCHSENKLAIYNKHKHVHASPYLCKPFGDIIKGVDRQHTRAL